MEQAERVRGKNEKRIENANARGRRRVYMYVYRPT
jgi:hypothetical protein